MLTEYGKKVRKARIDAGVTMMDMANALGASPAFISSMETGRKKVPPEWVSKVEQFFAGHGIELEGLRIAADVSNQSVSLQGLSSENRALVAGFARVLSSSPAIEQVNAFKSLLEGIQGSKK